ncbi:MAG TPA: hypothetical protein VF077_12585 [Nitrospiraceae bacterium]
MSSKLARHDRYGRPLPAVVPPILAATVADSTQRERRQALLAFLEEEWPELLARGCYAEVQVTAAIQDGRVQREVQVVVTRRVRME